MSKLSAERKYYDERPDLWAVLKFLKHTKDKSRWADLRKAVWNNLTEEERTGMVKAGHEMEAS